jgi:serine kinase of HPr protein (carbohydrate metabolism regulator)
VSAANDGRPLLVHGTAVAMAGNALLLRGPAGSGKSDLALRLICSPPGGLKLPGPPRLVADDQCLLSRESDRILIRPHANIAGMLEVRGHGIVRLPHVAESRLALIVDLVSSDCPSAAWPHTTSVCQFRSPA